MEVGINAPRFARGNWGIEYDESSQYIEVSDPDHVIEVGTDDMTFEGWFRTTATASGNQNRIFSRRATANAENPGYVINVSNGRLRFWLADGTNYLQAIWGSNLNDGNWHHFRILIDQALKQVSCYIDGQLQPETPSIAHLGNIVSPHNVLFLGVNSSHSFLGTLDELRIWKCLYTGPVGKVPDNSPGLLARWSFDEGDQGDGLAKDTAAPINLLTENQANGGEDGTTDGFSILNGTTISSDNTESWEGERSIKVVCPGVLEREGVRAESIPGIPGRVYTASAWVKASPGDKIRLRLREGNTSSISGVSATGDGSWQRLEISRTFASNDLVVVEVVTDEISQMTFYVDGLQLQEGDTATPWVPPKTAPYDGTITGATYTPDNAFGMPFGDSMLIEGSTSNIASEADSSVEDSLGGWVAHGTAAVTRSNLWSSHGDYSVMVTGSSSLDDRVEFSQSGLVGGELYTFSATVYSVTAQTITIRIGNRGEESWGFEAGEVKRIYVTAEASAVSHTMRLYGEGGTFFVDMVQVEQKPYPTSWTLGGTTREPEDHELHVPGIINFEEGQMDFDVYLPEGYEQRGGYLFAFGTNLDFRAFHSSTNGWFFRFNGSGNYLGSSNRPSPGHHRFTMTWEGMVTKVYIDGVLAKVNTPGTVASTSRNLFELGRRVTGTDVYFNSSFSGFRVRSTPMSDAEIAAEFGKPLTIDKYTTLFMPFNKSLECYYRSLSKVDNLSKYVGADGKIKIKSRSKLPSDGDSTASIVTSHKEIRLIDFVGSVDKNDIIVANYIRP